MKNWLGNQMLDFRNIYRDFREKFYVLRILCFVKLLFICMNVIERYFLFFMGLKEFF